MGESERSIRNILVLVGIVGLALATGIFLAVFATGGTFGQRCTRAFPDDPARVELCVYNLSNGKAP